jgi:glycosyltransferase involved in cell wall biosynthesis
MQLKETKNIVYLYSEVMPYAIAVMRALVQQHGATVDCIYWDKRKRTPFSPVNEHGITFHKRSDFDYATLKKFVEERHPRIIYVVGRMDKAYLKTALRYRRTCHVVTGSDNQWTGSLKQRIASLFSRLLYRRYFEYCWVPGVRQRTFAQKMGFPDRLIINNLLTADTAVFDGLFEQFKQVKKNSYPHTLVFAGRFTETKGVDLLVAAFNEVKAEINNDWQLILIGSGDMQVPVSEHIQVKGFMSSTELAADSKGWGVFCLPSRYEPWGVVVHEFAMAGLPMICSDAAGAADALVKDGYNGYTFHSGDKEALKKELLKIMAASDDELILMGAHSHELSKLYSPEIAANSLMAIPDNNHN